METIKHQKDTISNLRIKVEECSSKISKEIKILAEVEKIWIKYDKHKDTGFNLEEMSNYLTSTAYPLHGLTEDEVQTLFNHIDLDSNGQISKDEMTEFLSFMLKHKQTEPFI